MNAVPRLTVAQRHSLSRNGADSDERTPSSWAPIDLTDALAGADTPRPALLARIDGARILYRGRTHAFQGEPESCKTWGAAVAAHQAMEDDEDVLWVDFEDDERGVVARLRALGADVEMIREHFVYLRPDEPLSDRYGAATVGNAEFGQLLEDRQFGLAIIDGVTEAMVTEGLDLNSNADVAVWQRRLPRRLANTGAAVATLDHLVKSREGGPSRFAIGGQHKLAGLTGAAYRFDMVRPLTRATGTEPVEGLVTITVTKDRPGHVRAIAPDGKIGALQLTAWPDGGVTAALAPITGEPAPDLGLVHRIAAYLADYEGSSKKAIEEGVSGKTDAIRSAFRWMAAEDREWIRIERSGQTHRHYLTESGKD
jgi:hypothetical protein